MGETGKKIHALMNTTPWAVGGESRRVAGHGEMDSNIKIKDGGSMAGGKVTQNVAETYDVWDKPRQEANTYAIISAVNFTYGVGIDPEYVYNMYQILREVYTGGYVANERIGKLLEDCIIHEIGQ